MDLSRSDRGYDHCSSLRSRVQVVGKGSQGLQYVSCSSYGCMSCYASCILLYVSLCEYA